MPARKNPYYAGPPSDHFDGTRFFNPGGTGPKSLRDLMRWQFGEKRAPWPKQAENPVPQARPEPRVLGDRLVVTMVGHATLLIQTAGLNILTDPVWSPRASPMSFAGPKRRRAPGIAFDDLPKIDVVLLTHNHYDHLDLATLKRLKAAHDPVVLTPLGNDRIVQRKIPSMNVKVRDWGDHVSHGAATFHFEPCHHWSARGTRDRSMALWTAFVIETPGGAIHHVGDTGFDDGRPYRHVRERHGALRAAILPVGAYEPRWFMKDQHQDPDEAVAGFEISGAAWAIGHHWGTFRLTNEPIADPRERLHAALDRQGIARERFRPLLPGEVFDVPAL